MEDYAGATACASQELYSTEMWTAENVELEAALHVLQSSIRRAPRAPMDYLSF